MLAAIVRTIQFWGMVLARAGRESLATLGLGPKVSSVFLVVIVTAIYVLLVWQFVGQDEAGNVLVDTMLGWLAPLLIFPVIFLWKLVTVPAEIYGEIKTELKAITDSLVPRFTLEVANGGKPFDMFSGPTLTSPLTGAKQTQIRRHGLFVGLVCHNISPQYLHACSASIVSISPLGTDEEIAAFWGTKTGFIASGKPLEPVELQWVDGAKRVSRVEVPPGARRRILMFSVFEDHLYFCTDQLPVECVHYFTKGYSHLVVVTVSALDVPTVTAKVKVTWKDEISFELIP